MIEYGLEEMTTEDAIKALTNIHLNITSAQRANGKSMLCIIYRQAILKALEALKKQDKYYWHNLENNPDDLPRTSKNIIAVIKFVGDGSEFMNPISYTAGIYDVFSKQWNLDYDHKRYDEHNRRVSYKVIAWQYIDNFE